MLVVCTTVPDEPTARRMAAALVERRLAACVQVSGPIESVYRWRGAVETAAEWLCVAKTTADRWEEIECAIVELHPYDTPEIVATPLTHAADAYARWLRDETKPTGP